MPNVKKVLIISYYWPPCGGIAVLRSLKFSKYLEDYGWKPIVLAPSHAHYPTIDESNNKDLRDDLEVLRVPIWEPYGIYKFLTGQKKDANVNNVFYTQDKKLGVAHDFSVWVRSNFFIPDARKMWIKPCVKFLSNYLIDNPVDAIFSDGPPHTNTRIATIISEKFGIPWLADFQDPWTQVDYYQLLKLTKWGDQKHRKMEQEAFANASKTTIVSDAWKTELEKIGAKNVSVIPWGFDPDDYPENLPDHHRSKFSITHTGIMGYDRNPESFLNALKELSAESESFAADLELRLLGQVDHSIMQLIESLGLSNSLNFPGQVSRNEALDSTTDSVILLLLLNQQENAMGRIPGKLFEYLAARRPIISLGPSTGDAANIITGAKAGSAFEYNDQVGIKLAIRNLYAKYKEGQLDSAIESEIDQYTSMQLTKRLAGYLDEIVDGKVA